MLCPTCKSTATIVQDSRKESDVVRRRRACEKCGEVFFTEEKITSIGNRRKGRPIENKFRPVTKPVAKTGESRVKRYDMGRPVQKMVSHDKYNFLDSEEERLDQEVVDVGKHMGWWK